jgi:nucleotide sugar dehydrogenase
MKIGVIGAGRLGICFALLLEKAGYDVIVSDLREDYVISLNNRTIKTNEPEVADLLDDAKNFVATTDNIEVVKQCDIIYTLVATPSASDGSYDVSAVWKVIDEIQTAPEYGIDLNGKVFVVGCTTNPGDCEKFKEKLSPYGIDVFYNPEFIAQGSIIRDLRFADMVLIGGDDPNTRAKIASIYSKIQWTEPKPCFMSTTAAEIVKLAVNCFLTTKISYANMVGEVLTLSGLGNEIEYVLDAIGSDSRVGSKYMKYGFGYGGPCLPRDNRSFAAYAQKVGLKYNLGAVTDAFNEQHSKFLFEYFASINADGLPYYFPQVSYKKGTDILTESGQYKLCIDLLDAGYKVYIGDNQSILDQIMKPMLEYYGDRVAFVSEQTEINEDFILVGL